MSTKPSCQLQARQVKDAVLMPKQPIDQCLLDAYQTTAYRVLSDVPCVLRIDHFSPQLMDLYAHYRVDSAVFITAWNPFSTPLSDAENTARQARLLMTIHAAGYHYLPGFGEPAEGSQWAAEASVLVLGVSQGEACAWGRSFEQNAIVWAGADAIPRLHILLST